MDFVQPSDAAKQFVAQHQPPKLTKQDPTIAAQMGRLRQKYAATTPSNSGYNAVTNSSFVPPMQPPSLQQTAENNKQVSAEDMAGYERLSRVKICSSCEGQGTVRLQFHHHYVNQDCNDCNGEGYYRLETNEAKISKAKEFKTKATLLFQQKEYNQADALFQEGINAIVSFRVGVEANSLRLALLSNRAMCALKMNNWTICCEHCRMVLKQDSTNIKALWRLSVALEALNEISKAIACLESMLTTEPGHSKGIASLNRLQLLHAKAIAIEKKEMQDKKEDDGLGMEEMMMEVE